MVREGGHMVKIENIFVGDDHPCFIVAEIGINHNGSLEIAKKMIDLAAESGCDAVKFQKRTPDLCVPDEQKNMMYETPWGLIPYIEYRHKIEFGQKGYEQIDDYCRRKGIMWFASCWDEDSVDFIEKFDPPCYKIGSASLTDRNLLLHTRFKNKPVILSTGMSTMEQVYGAVDTLGREDLILLHCVGTYPVPDHENNLRVINTLRETFPEVPIGYSGHCRGTTLGVCAVALGACVVERHITLDREMWGSNQAASLGPEGLKLMVGNIRRLELALGDGVKRVLESEVPLIMKLRRKVDF
ncbi:MAG: N-acetylneuraminate synthase [Parcubacteria group bacterium GW2011_GWC1_43_61]|nr:MAG: N-acetylneuraminate synthase [Candidatus Azambacteria bacterium GW2011_GWA2_42_62]KKT16453.1 MAG: N-acetylneuraminate synthase [Parcubacteria group bacterium GW2011_GWC1_43_61]